MMKIAFVGHAHHKQTRSADFFVALLESLGTVDLFYDDSLDGGVPVDVDELVLDYSLILIWQIEYLVPVIMKRGLRNIVFVPMYDGCRMLPDSYWPTLGNTKILCFSTRLYEQLQALGCHCSYARYCPPPEPLPATVPATAGHSGSLSGFYWYRRSSLTLEGLSAIVEKLGLTSITIHYSPDPSEQKIIEREQFSRVLKIPVQFTTWFDTRGEYLKEIAKSQVYIASREFEGIGMSFLEAMSLGMVVVAPDNPTMNEYIIHGHHGLLYDPWTFKWHDVDLDFRKMAENARRSMLKGYLRWQNYQPFLLEWLSDPESIQSFFYDRLFASEKLGDGGGEQTVEIKQPSEDRQNARVTIATVVRNAVNDIEQTITNVVSQTYPDLEYIIVDGASTDGTQEVIEKHSKKITRFISEPDQGTYDAMNKAASMATGRWILFMNAGDTFLSPRSLEDFMTEVPDDADFIVGHHVYQNAQGSYSLHLANDFDVTYRRLVSGNMDGWWLRGIPCHQSTATRTELLARNKYDLDYKIAADHEFMYRCRQNGARFFLSDNYVSLYKAGGESWQNVMVCINEWLTIALKYSGNKKGVVDFYEEVQKHHHVEKLANLPLVEAFKYLLNNPGVAKKIFLSTKHLRMIPRHIYNKMVTIYRTVLAN